MGCLYKVVSKILSDRIKKVLPKVIDDNQFAFLGGRSILDSVLIANEVVHDAKSKKVSALIFKVDFEKAYDSIRWQFLKYMMKRLNFCDKWISWILGCLESSYVSVLVNGSPTNEFRMEKGVRQGDPIAPFLFLIVAEGLNGIVKRAVDTNNFRPLNVGKDESVALSLLQYADDALFFGEASLQNVIALKCILRCYEMVSGLKVNFFKSKLAGITTSDDALARFASFLHCRPMDIPFVYLGLPVGGNPRRLSTWDPVVTKLRKRLSSWKGRHLSFGGRVCLIKSVLTALPLYFFSFFRVPKGVLRRCIQIMTSFIWGGPEEDKKICWVSWSRICRPKSEGGLGVRNLDSFNVALLSKWRWRMLHEHDQLWCKVLLSKYGDGMSSKASPWWKDLLKTCVGAPSGFWFENNLSWRIGEGNNTLFWEENWQGTDKFQDVFPELYQISDQKGCSLQEVGAWVENKWVWQLRWQDDVVGLRSSRLSELRRIIQSFSPNRGVKDKWFWIKEGSGVFTVRSAYEALCPPNVELEEDCFKLLWRFGAPSNAIALGWKVLLNRLQTKDNLVHRNIPISDLQCALCGFGEESVHHLFFSCSRVWDIWSRVLKWLGLVSVLSGHAKEHLVQFLGLWPSPIKSGLSIVWLAVIWQVWLARNGKFFQDSQFEPADVFDLARLRAWEWLKIKNRSFVHSPYEWLNEPLHCLSDI